MGTRSSKLNHEFESTRWSLVTAAKEGNSGRQTALAELCEIYWPPIYAYARRRGHEIHDAQDLTQAFFARLLARSVIASADPDRGRFRAFLVSSFRNFVANEWDRENALKRGGGRSALPLDFASSEKNYVKSQADLTPDQLFERQWAAALLDRVVQMLRDEFEVAGKLDQFDTLKVFLAGKTRERNYRETGQQLGITEQAAMSVVSRMRRRYRELLTAEISHTVSDPAEIDDEIRSLFRSLG